MNSIFLTAQGFNGFANFIGNLCGRGRTLLLEREQDSIVAIDFGIHFIGVVGVRNIRYVRQGNGAEIPNIHIKEHQIAQLFFVGKLIPNLDGKLLFSILQITSRHGEILRRQHLA